MSLRGQAARVVAIALGAALVASPSALGAADTYQADGRHSGNVDAPFKPPLGKKWVRRGLGANLSYPVIGDGKVFVTAAAPTGTLLYALKRRTGATVWVRPVPSGGKPAYANGRVFVAGDDDLKAYSAASGQQLWLLEHPGAPTPPVTDDNLVYVGDEEGVKSYEQITGAPVASGSTEEEGYGTAPGVALTDTQVYGAVGCHVYMYSKGLGEPVWDHQSPCGGSVYGLFPPQLAAGRVFARAVNGRGTELDATLGFPKDTFNSLGGPAFSGNLAFYRGRTTVQARRIDTGTIAWTRKSRSNGFASSPLVVRGVVYVLRGDGTVLGLDRRTGRTRWSRRLYDSPSSPSYASTGAVTDGMAADGAGLVVPSGSRLTAFGRGRDKRHVEDADKFSGSGTSVHAKLAHKYAWYRRHVGIRGTVSRGGGGVNDHLELQASTYPYRVWRTVRRTTADYGSFGFTVAPTRTTRYRVVDVDTAPMRASGTMRLYLAVRFDVRFRDADNDRFRIAASILAPPYLHVEKRPMYVYRLHTRHSHGTRIGHLPVRRRSTAHYRSQGHVQHHIGRGEYFSVCVPVERDHAVRDFAPRCGRKHL